MSIFTVAVVAVTDALDFESSCHFVAFDCSGENETEWSGTLKIESEAYVRALNAPRNLGRTQPSLEGTGKFRVYLFDLHSAALGSEASFPG